MSLQEPSKDSSARTSPANASRKPPASERRIQANRRNALRSTGPKTERGKRTVARNAIKHGLLAREVVITAGDGEERLEEFHKLLNQLHECYKPVGVVEGLLVQTMATCWWKKARVIRAENGEIRTRLDTLTVDRAVRDSNEGNLDLALSAMDLSSLYRATNQADQQVSTRGRWSRMQAAESDLRRHRSSLAYVGALLLEAKSEMASYGYLSQTNLNRILDAFGLTDCLFALVCMHAGARKTKTENPLSEKVADQQTDEKVDQETNETLIVAAKVLIDDRLETISKEMEYATEREKLALDAEMRSFSLPPAEATDKLLRYEAHLDRQLYRAMDQLERLQRQRQGENVPPPLNINLGKKAMIHFTKQSQEVLCFQPTYNTEVLGRCPSLNL